MKTAEENRRAWLDKLIQEYGSIANLNNKLDRDRTDATLSQIKNQSAHHKTGKPRAMGSDIARDIEVKLGLERGALDYPPNHGQGAALIKRVESVFRVNEPVPTAYLADEWPFKTIRPADWRSLPLEQRDLLELQIRALLPLVEAHGTAA
jgi:hypothetical protein